MRTDVDPKRVSIILLLACERLTGLNARTLPNQGEKISVFLCYDALSQIDSTGLQSCCTVGTWGSWFDPHIVPYYVQVPRSLTFERVKSYFKICGSGKSNGTLNHTLTFPGIPEKLSSHRSLTENMLLAIKALWGGEGKDWLHHLGWEAMDENVLDLVHHWKRQTNTTDKQTEAIGDDDHEQQQRQQLQLELFTIIREIPGRVDECCAYICVDGIDICRVGCCHHCLPICMIPCGPLAS